MSGTIKILALCATYNRRNVTLAALKSLQAQELPPDATMQIAVVDDSSSDGTLDAIRNELPGVITVGCGGELYWAGAMRFGLSYFWNSKQYSHLLVFNDDCTLYPNAVAMLLDVAENSSTKAGVVVVAALRDKLSGALTYGGFRRKRWRPVVYFDRVMPTCDVQVIDTLNMNLALISRQCLERNILIRDDFTHSLADVDFGLRASSNGSPIYLAPGFLGECSRNNTKGTWEDNSLPFDRRWFLIRQPKGLPLRPRFRYLKLHAPYVWPAIFIWPYLRLCISHLLTRGQQLVIRGSDFLRQSGD